MATSSMMRLPSKTLWPGRVPSLAARIRSRLELCNQMRTSLKTRERSWATMHTSGKSFKTQKLRMKSPSTMSLVSKTSHGNTLQTPTQSLSLGKRLITYSTIPDRKLFLSKCSSRLKSMPECNLTIRRSWSKSCRSFARLRSACAATERMIAEP